MNTKEIIESLLSDKLTIKSVDFCDNTENPQLSREILVSYHVDSAQDNYRIDIMYIIKADEIHKKAILIIEKNGENVPLLNNPWANVPSTDKLMEKVNKLSKEALGIDITEKIRSVGGQDEV